MFSIIVIESGAKQEALEDTLRTLSEHAPERDTIVVANNAPTISTTASFVSAKDTNISKAVQTALWKAKESTIVFIDARLSLTPAQLETITNGIDTEVAIGYFQIEAGDQLINLDGISIENLVDNILPQRAWPTAVIVASKEHVATIEDPEALSGMEVLGQFLVSALADGFGPEMMQSSIVADPSTAKLVSTFSASDSAGVLRFAVNSCNIEDLYPNHAWKVHEQESAAACYHTLAAKFIRFGDMESAKQCLTFSDQLEDSPRSLALKAMISLGKGETLGAVANLVSSLQQYEVRKRNQSNEHYLTFNPDNLEFINSSLHRGLQALNQKNNEAALEHFAQAVFSFDDFYQKNGVDGLIN